MWLFIVRVGQKDVSHGPCYITCKLMFFSVSFFYSVLIRQRRRQYLHSPITDKTDHSRVLGSFVLNSRKNSRPYKPFFTNCDLYLLDNNRKWKIHSMFIHHHHYLKKFADKSFSVPSTLQTCCVTVSPATIFSLCPTSDQIIFQNFVWKLPDFIICNCFISATIQNKTDHTKIRLTAAFPSATIKLRHCDTRCFI